MSVRELAKKAKLAESTIYDLERGDSQSTTKLHLIADATGVRVQWLETGKGAKRSSPPNLEEVPAAQSMEMAYVDKVIGGNLSAGMGQVLWDFEQVDRSHAFRLDWMQSKGLNADRCKVWTVRGDSMDPKYPHGSWVLINMAETQPVHGKNYALIGEDGVRLKQLRRSASGGWEMHSLNADKDKYPPEPIVDDNYTIIGRVRGHGGDDD